MYKNFVSYLIFEEYQKDFDKYIGIYMSYYSLMIKFLEDQLKLQLEILFHLNNVHEDIQE